MGRTRNRSLTLLDRTDAQGFRKTITVFLSFDYHELWVGVRFLKNDGWGGVYERWYINFLPGATIQVNIDRPAKTIRPQDPESRDEKVWELNSKGW